MTQMPNKCKHQSQLIWFCFFLVSSSFKHFNPNASTAMAKANSIIAFSFDTAVKGYHECSFVASIGDTFYAQKKWEKVAGLRLINYEGEQLGHIQKELVPLLWDVEGTLEIKW